MRFFESIGTISIFLSKRAEAGFPGRHGTTDENNLSERKLRERACDPKNPIFDFGEDDHLYDKNRLSYNYEDNLEVKCKYDRYYWTELTCEDGTYKAADPDDCPACDPKNPSFDFGDDADYYDTSSYEYKDWYHTIKCSLIPDASADLSCDKDGKFKPYWDKCDSCDRKNPSFDFGNHGYLYDTTSYEFKDGEHQVKCSITPTLIETLRCVDGTLKPSDHVCYHDDDVVELMAIMGLSDSYDSSSGTIPMEKFTDIQKFALKKRGDKMMEAIVKADQNGDGQIDVREFRDQVHEMDKKERRNTNFKLRDTNNDQVLDENELSYQKTTFNVTQVMNDVNRDGKFAVDEALVVVDLELKDQNNDGFYSYDESRLIPIEYDENGFPPEDIDWRNCPQVNFLDIDGDSKVTYDEYITKRECTKTEADWVDANGNDCAKYRALGWCSRYNENQKLCVWKDNCYANTLCCPKD